MIRLGKKKFNFLEIGGVFFAGLCFVLSMSFLDRHSMRQELVLEIATAETSTFQIFWRESSESFKPKNSQTLRLRPSQSEYRIALPQLIGVDFLRFDPLDKPASLQIKAARLILPRDTTLDFLPILAESAETLHEMALSRDAADGTLHITSSGNDPNFAVSIKDLIVWKFDRKFIFAGLAVPVLLFGVLFRQELLKGSREKGILTLSLPQGVLPMMSAVRNMSGLAGVRQEKRKDKSLYLLDVRGIEERSLSDLMGRLKKDNPEATIRFQYNRSGEA